MDTLFSFLPLALVIVAVIWLIHLASKPRQKAPQYRAFRFSDLSFTENELSDELHTKVRGVTFNHRQDIIREKCCAGDLLVLVREPNNPKDVNAIAVRRLLWDGTSPALRAAEQIGYLSWRLAEDFAPVLDSGMSGYARINQITGDDINGVNLEIYIFKAKSIPDQRLISATAASNPVPT
jgi:hypothetical protein